jgi:hypothetical protein
MPTNWVISAHAASYMQDQKVGSSTIKVVELIRLPPGVSFIHFVPEATGFPVDTAWVAYNCLMTNPPDIAGVKKVPGQKQFKGVSLPNYKITGDNSWIDGLGQSASGIFIAGDTYHKDARTYYIPAGQWYSLKQFFDEGWAQAGDIIFWLCCRSWMNSKGESVPFPSPPPPPPRPLKPPPVPTSVLAGLKPGSVHSAPLVNPT